MKENQLNKNTKMEIAVRAKNDGTNVTDHHQNI